MGMTSTARPLPIDQDSPAAQKWAAIQMILRDELENYGYGMLDWARIKRQRRMAFEALRAACPTMEAVDRLHWNYAGPRLTWKGDRPFYCVGQSSNEELTNLAWRLVNGRDADWLS